MNKNMSKLLLLVSALVVTAGYAHADSRALKTPTNQGGLEAAPQYSGAKYKIVSDTTEAIVCASPCVITGVLLSTGATTAFAVIRDTATADGTGTIVLPRMPFNTAPTTGHQGNLYIGVRMTKGATVKLNSIGSGEHVTVLYLEQ